MADIGDLTDRLEARGGAYVGDVAGTAAELRRFECVPVHSELPHEDQARAFAPATDGRFKVVLATNSAESSVTLPDCDDVLDLGAHKALRYDAASHRAVLAPAWPLDAVVLNLRAMIDAPVGPLLARRRAAVARPRLAAHFSLSGAWCVFPAHAAAFDGELAPDPRAAAARAAARPAPAPPAPSPRSRDVLDVPGAAELLDAVFDRRVVDAAARRYDDECAREGYSHSSCSTPAARAAQDLRSLLEALPAAVHCCYGARHEGILRGKPALRFAPDGEKGRQAWESGEPRPPLLNDLPVGARLLSAMAMGYRDNQLRVWADRPGGPPRYPGLPPEPPSRRAVAVKLDVPKPAWKLVLRPASGGRAGAAGPALRRASATRAGRRPLGAPGAYARGAPLRVVCRHLYAITALSEASAAAVATGDKGALASPLRADALGPAATRGTRCASARAARTRSRARPSRKRRARTAARPSLAHLVRDPLDAAVVSGGGDHARVWAFGAGADGSLALTVAREIDCGGGATPRCFAPVSSPAATLLAVGGDEGTLSVWAVDGDRPRLAAVAEDTRSPVVALAAARDGSSVVAVDEAGQIRSTLTATALHGAARGLAGRARARRAAGPRRRRPRRRRGVRAALSASRRCRRRRRRRR
ncbi:helicase [Aureococcus anophagefferens]|nr:helicase [Aureococcus anophagefferens]